MTRATAWETTGAAPPLCIIDCSNDIIHEIFLLFEREYMILVDGDLHVKRYITNDC